MMETRGVVEVGDHHWNSLGHKATVVSTENGTHGILICVRFDVPPFNLAWSFLIPELPAIDRIYGWYGWSSRGHILLPDGGKIGNVDFARGDKRTGIIEEYDAKWERTLAEWRQDGHSDWSTMQSRPLPVAENVQRME